MTGKIADVRSTARRRSNQAMRTDVVLVSSSFWPREGGAERQLRQVLSAAEQAGLSCAVVTHALPNQSRRAEVNGIHVRRVGSAWLTSRFPRLGQILCTAAQARQVLRLRPRTAVTIQIGAASMAVALVRRMSQTRHIVRLTGGGTGKWRSEPWARRATRVGRLVVWAVARRGVVIISPARHLLVDLAEAFPRSAATARLIPNGVPDPGSPTDCDHARSGVVWYARGGSVRSGPAFLSIAEACSDLDILAIGQTGDLPDVPAVRRLGWVEDPYTVLQDCRVLLNTSPTEGMPNMALQALAAGLYVVGPSNAGLVELADTYPDHVKLVDITQPEDVAEVLRSLHSSALPGPAAVPRSADVARVWLDLFCDRSSSDPTSSA